MTKALSGGAQVQTHHVAQLLHEEWIIGQFEALGAMRLQSKELEVALHAGLGDARLCGHAAHAPVRRAIYRLGVQRGVDQLRDPLIVDGAWRTGANVIVQTGDAPLNEARAPLSHGGVSQLQPRGDRVVGLALCAAKNNARPAAQCRRQRAAARKRLQLEIARRHSVPIQISVCLFSSRYLRSKDTAPACKTNAIYLQDRTLGAVENQAQRLGGL